VAGDHDLGAAIVVRGVADLALGRRPGDFEGRVVFETQEGRHGALPDRDGVLHGVAADPQQAGGVGDGKASGGREGRIFAKRMPRHEGGVPLQVETGLGLQDADRRQADGHEGRLGVGRESEVLGRPLPHDCRELLRQGLVHLVEDRPGLGKRLGEGLAHPDRLTSLSREDECALHEVPSH
jgi:hypothetical protein